jgi:hypothetical protein
MREKSIKSVLQKKFNNWIGSIENEKLKKTIEENAIITGGCIVSLLQNEKPHDYDVYFKTKVAAKAVAEYYVDQWVKAHGATANHIQYKVKPFVLDGADVEAWKQGLKKLPEIAPNHSEDIPYSSYTGSGERNISHMITNTPEDRIKIIYPSDGIVEEEAETPDIDEVIESMDDLSEMDADMLEKAHPDESEDAKKYRPIFMSTNAITLSNGIQIVIRFWGEPDVIHTNYDFAHCLCYWQSWNGKLELPKEALLSIMNKELIYRGSKYPICSIIRTRKFINRGWHINAGQYLKMCFQVSELDLQNIDVLEDQLVGVDSLYFLAVVDSLRKLKEKDGAKQFDSTYLNSIIDKIF